MTIFSTTDTDSDAASLIAAGGEQASVTVQHDASAESMKLALEQLYGVGQVNVSRSPTSFASNGGEVTEGLGYGIFRWTVTFLEKA